VSELLRKGKPVRSGFVTSETKFVFRSRSAKFYLLIQMSCEMWDFEQDGELYFEKANLFLRTMFSKWKASSANHTLSLVLFTRLYYAEYVRLPSFPSREKRKRRDLIIKYNKSERPSSTVGVALLNYRLTLTGGSTVTFIRHLPMTPLSICTWRVTRL